MKKAKKKKRGAKKKGKKAGGGGGNEERMVPAQSLDINFVRLMEKAKNFGIQGYEFLCLQTNWRSSEKYGGGHVYTCVCHVYTCVYTVKTS